MPILSEYLQLHSAVQAELELSGRFIDLVHEGFDVGARICTLDDSTLSSRRLGSLRYGLYASPAFLKRHPIRRVETLGRAEERMIANNHWSLRSAALSGLGVAFSPTLLMKESVRSGALVHVHPEWTPPEIPNHAVFPSQRHLAPKVRFFTNSPLRMGMTGLPAFRTRAIPL